MLDVQITKRMLGEEGQKPVANTTMRAQTSLRQQTGNTNVTLGCMEKHQFLSLKPNKKTDPWSTNQKPINRPSYKTVKTIVLGAVQSATSRKEHKGLVQFISNQYQWQHQTNTQDKTQNLGDQRIPSCKNKDASKQGGTYVAC